MLSELIIWANILNISDIFVLASLSFEWPVTIELSK